jgi:23S rRNA pseudouridine2605 synthase
MRINKYIASAGIASRRKADELILSGNVKINGLTVRELGTDVKEGDVVEVNGRRIDGAEKHVYIMLNKPLGYVTTSSDDRDRATVMDLVADIPERIFPIGRLDYNTSGLLLLTNDGELAYRLTHPKHRIYKTYRAVVHGVLSAERVAKLRKGVDIGGFVTSPAKVRVIKQGERSATVEISIYEGKNRQVRKMFAAVGNRVQSLERVAMGEIYLARLMTGHYRRLTPKEVEYLKLISEDASQANR